MWNKHAEDDGITPAAKMTATTTPNTHTRLARRYRGVSQEAHNKKWRARIYCQGIHVTLGRFSSAREAARAHDRAACFLYQDKAMTNFGVAAAQLDLQSSPPSTSPRTMLRLRVMAEEIQSLDVYHCHVRKHAAVQCGLFATPQITLARRTRVDAFAVAALMISAVRYDEAIPSAVVSIRKCS